MAYPLYAMQKSEERTTMKKMYEAAMLDILPIANEDVLTASEDSTQSGGGFDTPYDPF